MSLTKATFSMIDGAAVNILDYGAVANGTTDCLSAFTAAIATGKAVYVPDTGDNAFYISAPITSVQNMALFGNAEGQIDSTRTARIYAPDIKYKSEIQLTETQAIASKTGCKWHTP